jgi:cellulose synthase operon protein C
VGWALEHAATATEDSTQRLLLWARLGRHWRDVMQDEKQAAIFEARVARMKEELADQMPEGLVGGPLEVPLPPRRSPEPPPPPSSNAFESESKSMTLTARPRRRTKKEPAVGDGWTAKSTEGQEKKFFDEALSGEDDVVELKSEDIELPSAELLVKDVKLPAVPDQVTFALGDPELEVPPSFSGPAVSNRVASERHALFERVRSAPLDLRGYQMLADHFDVAGESVRASMMREIADGLDGEHVEQPKTPRLILTASDRAGLRHPTLRGDAGEFLGLAGVALCRLYPARGPGKGTNVEFTIEAGKGAKAAADALLAAVRILGIRAPDVYLAADNGPPFSLAWVGAPRVLVGKLAVKRDVPEAELRFFAGRALFTQNPDLLALRDLRREQIEKGLGVLREVVQRRPTSLEAKMVRESMPQRGFERFKELLSTAASNLDLAALAEGARHSANRAGLVVCGGIGPAIAALRAKRALESELIEMVRFASSERYLGIRSRAIR